jgi:hypothetical protein
MLEIGLKAPKSLNKFVFVDLGAKINLFHKFILERWQSGRSRALGERVTARSQGSNPCLSAN